MTPVGLTISRSPRSSATLYSLSLWHGSCPCVQGPRVWALRVTSRDRRSSFFEVRVPVETGVNVTLKTTRRRKCAGVGCRGMP
jgi:hypothetical protein